MINLARNLRPSNFDELLGQEHLCAQGSPLRTLAQTQTLNHSFFYGPPGCGKTSLARLIAKVMELPFYEFNATSLKIDDLRKVFAQYKNALQRPLIFIDEVHRLAKNQQEVLLPVMEEGSILLIGVSTENPFFSLTAAMRSRAMLFELNAINNSALESLLERVCLKESLSLDEEAKEYIIHISAGDARALLNLLESAANLNKNIDKKLLQSLKPSIQSGGSSESGNHYDLASALIKSIRGSDADAAVYYLARLIEGGEPPEFIARRLVILASEDVGNANPQALTLSTSCMTSVAKIGYPEARIILSQTVIYLSASPKSNSAYMAINQAQQAVRSGEILPILEIFKPHNKEYLYPHDFGGYVRQKYLAKPLHFVELKAIGFEQKMREWLSKIKQ